MQLTTADAQAKVAAVTSGTPVWGTTLGVGSFLTFEMGNPQPAGRSRAGSGEDKTHGDVHVWVYCSAWRMETDEVVLASSEDDRDRLASAVLVLDGKLLSGFEIAQPSLAATFTFSDGLKLVLFPIFTDGYEHWMIFLPGGDVITAGPGSALSIGR